jgi:hypothetical protein
MKYNNIISFLFIIILFSSFSSAFSWDQTQIEAYYSFDQLTGTVIDEKGNFDGTNFGTTRGELGRLNNSFLYEDDEADYVNLTANPLFGIGGGDFSVNVWFNPEEMNGSTKTIVSLGYDIIGITDATFGINIDSSNNTRIFYYQDGVFNVNNVLGTAIENTWYMASAVRQGNRAIGYLDGVEVYNVSITGSYNSLFRNFGKIGDSVHPSSRSPFDGKIDDTGIWNVSLNSSEVLDLYNSGLGKFYNEQFGSPIIEINSPSPENNQLNLSDITNIFNVTLQGSSLSNVSLFLNGELNDTIAISGSTNNTFFSKVLGQGSYNWSIEVCDDNICSNSENRTLILSDYLENSINYNTPTIEGTTESFVYNISLASGVSVSSAFFTYNGSSYTTNINAGTYTTLTSSIAVPDLASDSNLTFSWNVTLSTAENFLSTINSQEVLVLSIDDCSVLTNTVFNISLFDERLLTPIFGTIEVDMDLQNLDGSLVTQLATNITNATTTGICSNINLSSGSYTYGLELRYYSSPDGGASFTHVPEFYHIQQGDVTLFPLPINLYDLNINESTEFTIFYRDNNYIKRPDVLLQIMRSYVSEGISRTIEIPITSSEGTATAHFDLNNYKYSIIATQNGEVLNTFDNPTIRCESVLSGICEIVLNGQSTPPSVQFLSDENNFFYTINSTNTTVTIVYSIPSGESKNVNITMIQLTPFQDPNTICSQEILTSSGSITCSINATIGDSQVNVRIVSNGEVKADFVLIFEEDLSAGWLLNNYFIAFLLLLTLMSMTISSPQVMVIASVFGVVYLGFIFLLKGSSVGLALGAIGFLFLVAIIIITKMSKKDE